MRRNDNWKQHWSCQFCVEGLGRLKYLLDVEGPAPSLDDISLWWLFAQKNRTKLKNIRQKINIVNKVWQSLMNKEKKLTERFVLIEVSESFFFFDTQPLEQTFDLKFPPSDTTSGESRLCWCVVDVSEDRISGISSNFVCWRPHNFNLVVLVIWAVTSAVTCSLFSPSEA